MNVWIFVFRFIIKFLCDRIRIREKIWNVQIKKKMELPPQQKPPAPMDLTPLLFRSAIRGWVSSHALSYKDNIKFA